MCLYGLNSEPSRGINLIDLDEIFGLKFKWRSYLDAAKESEVLCLGA